MKHRIVGTWVDRVMADLGNISLKIVICWWGMKSLVELRSGSIVQPGFDYFMNFRKRIWGKTIKLKIKKTMT